MKYKPGALLKSTAIISVVEQNLLEYKYPGRQKSWDPSQFIWEMQVNIQIIFILSTANYSILEIRWGFFSSNYHTLQEILIFKHFKCKRHKVINEKMNKVPPLLTINCANQFVKMFFLNNWGLLGKEYSWKAFLVSLDAICLPRKSRWNSPILLILGDLSTKINRFFPSFLRLWQCATSKYKKK